MAALALSETIFQPYRHRLVGFFNAALYAKGSIVGHIGVELLDVDGPSFFDMDGFAKCKERMQSWGHLEAEDVLMHGVHAADEALGADWSHQVTIVELFPGDLQDMFGIQSHQLDWAKETIESAQRQVSTNKTYAPQSPS